MVPNEVGNLAINNPNITEFGRIVGTKGWEEKAPPLTEGPTTRKNYSVSSYTGDCNPFGGTATSRQCELRRLVAEGNDPRTHKYWTGATLENILPKGEGNVGPEEVHLLSNAEYEAGINAANNGSAAAGAGAGAGAGAKRTRKNRRARRH